MFETIMELIRKIIGLIFFGAFIVNAFMKNKHWTMVFGILYIGNLLGG